MPLSGQRRLSVEVHMRRTPDVVANIGVRTFENIGSRPKRQQLKPLHHSIACKKVHGGAWCQSDQSAKVPTMSRRPHLDRRSGDETSQPHRPSRRAPETPTRETSFRMRSDPHLDRERQHALAGFRL